MHVGVFLCAHFFNATRLGPKVKIWSMANVTFLVGMVADCSRPADVGFASAQGVQKLKPELQKQVRGILLDQCGTPKAPILLGSGRSTSAHLKQGSAIYARYWVQCHGVSGDGNGPAAVYMLPKPRDYRPGIFKSTSTPYGAKPLREDLIRTVKRGIRGTFMPSFALLPPGELDAVVDYDLTLTHRGELESQLAEEAEFTDSLPMARVPELVKAVMNRWDQARGQIVYPTTTMPQFTAADVDHGKKAFMTVGCSQCHGEDGRGQMLTNVGVDSWGNPTKAADLTSGMLRGGTEPIDIYRHIDAGINGTPMPSFHATLQKEPETTWSLVAYVLTIADSRRSGTIPDAGLLENGILKPLPGVKPAPATALAPGGTKKDVLSTQSVHNVTQR
jgi:mono/diheme cytochrome c family protein